MSSHKSVGSSSNIKIGGLLPLLYMKKVVVSILAGIFFPTFLKLKPDFDLGLGCKDLPVSLWIDQHTSLHHRVLVLLDDVA